MTYSSPNLDISPDNQQLLTDLEEDLNTLLSSLNNVQTELGAFNDLDYDALAQAQDSVPQALGRIHDISTQASDNIISIANDLPSGMSDVITAIQEVSWEEASTALSTIEESIKTDISQEIEGVDGQAQIFIGTLEAWMMALSDLSSAIISNGQLLVGEFNAFTDAVEDQSGTTQGAIGQLKDAVEDFGSTITTDYQATLVSSYQDLTNEFINSCGNISNSMEQQMGEIEQSLSDFQESVSNAIADMKTQALNSLDEATQIVDGDTQDRLANLTADIEETISNIQSKIDGYLNTVHENDAVIQGLEIVGSAIETGKQIVSNVRDFLSSMVGG